MHVESLYSQLMILSPEITGCRYSRLAAMIDLYVVHRFCIKDVNLKKAQIYFKNKTFIAAGLLQQG